MTDEENKKRADLFGDPAPAKPLFGEEEALPQGKPLFDSEFSDTGDAAFVKPLFETVQEEDDRTTLEDFQEFDNMVEASDENGSYEPAAEYAVEAENTDEYAVEAEPADVEELNEELVPPSNPFAESEPEAAVPENNPFAAPVQTPEVPVVPEPDFMQPEQPPAPAFAIPSAKVSISGDLEAMSLGALMAYARDIVKLTPEDVYNGTKINEKYLLAIENDQFDKLPSGSFPGAYVRSLCSFYHLENNVREIAQKKAAAFCTECRPPDDVYTQLNEHAIINKEEQEKFRRIVTIAGIVLLVIVLSIVSIVIFWSGDDETEAVPAASGVVDTKVKDSASKVPSPVKMESLEKLDAEPPQIVPSELNVPK